jgi:hypothetical protein
MIWRLGYKLSRRDLVQEQVPFLFHHEDDYADFFLGNTQPPSPPAGGNTSSLDVLVDREIIDRIQPYVQAFREAVDKACIEGSWSGSYMTLYPLMTSICTTLRYSAGSSINTTTFRIDRGDFDRLVQRLQPFQIMVDNQFAGGYTAEHDSISRRFDSALMDVVSGSKK